MAIRVVGLDGDDTLWHNETRFVLTQTAFNDLLRRHVPDADVEGHLAEVEMKNLGMYGYGVKAFTLSVIEAAIQLTRGENSPPRPPGGLWLGPPQVLGARGASPPALTSPRL